MSSKMVSDSGAYSHRYRKLHQEQQKHVAANDTTDVEQERLRRRQLRLDAQARLRKLKQQSEDQTRAEEERRQKILDQRKKELQGASFIKQRKPIRSKHRSRRTSRSSSPLYEDAPSELSFAARPLRIAPGVACETPVSRRNEILQTALQTIQAAQHADDSFASDLSYDSLDDGAAPKRHVGSQQHGGSFRAQVEHQHEQLYGGQQYDHQSTHQHEQRQQYDRQQQQHDQRHQKYDRQQVMSPPVCSPAHVPLSPLPTDEDIENVWASIRSMAQRHEAPRAYSDLRHLSRGSRGSHGSVAAAHSDVSAVHPSKRSSRALPPHIRNAPIHVSHAHASSLRERTQGGRQSMRTRLPGLKPALTKTSYLTRRPRSATPPLSPESDHVESSLQLFMDLEKQVQREVMSNPQPDGSQAAPKRPSQQPSRTAQDDVRPSAAPAQERTQDTRQRHAPFRPARSVAREPPTAPPNAVSASTLAFQEELLLAEVQSLDKQLTKLGTVADMVPPKPAPPKDPPVSAKRKARRKAPRRPPGPPPTTRDIDTAEVAMQAMLAANAKRPKPKTFRRYVKKDSYLSHLDT